jgi:outer membrane protein OmpA-like peptidoglycan-associated protein
LVIREADGSERAAIVRLQAFNHVGASMVLWDRVRLGLNLPVLSWQNGEDGNIGNTRYSASTNASIGDLRLSSDVRLYGQYGQRFTTAAGLQIHLPSGDRASYTGDDKVRVGPRWLAAGQIGDDIAYAARLGFLYRPRTDFGDTYVGSEMSYGVSAGYRFWNGAGLIGPELYGATGINASDVSLKSKTTPMEMLLGAHYRLGPSWHVDLGAGTALTRGLGAPLLRVVAAIEWAPLYEPPAERQPDRDHDRLPDPSDACPEVPGLPTYDPRTNGCVPAPADRDSDRIIDMFDACPDQPGPSTQDPKTNGCPPPPPDADGDGVIDPEDACPSEPGVRTDDPKTNGCPPPKDRDGDGILDPQDACPDQPGPADPDPAKNGCPVARIEGKQIKITEQIKFAFGRADILPESEAVLNAVAAIMTQHPEIKKVSIEGHTDNHGADQLNLVLSRTRAASVVNWLVRHGIDAKRLSSAGFGKTRPIDTNDTEVGRKNNRRVEFQIIEPKNFETQPPASAPPASSAPATTPKGPAAAPSGAASATSPQGSAAAPSSAAPNPAQSPPAAASSAKPPLSPAPAPSSSAPLPPR